MGRVHQYTDAHTPGKRQPRLTHAPAMLQPELRFYTSARAIHHSVTFDHLLASLLASGKDCGGGLLRRSGYRQGFGNCRAHRVGDGRLR